MKVGVDLRQGHYVLLARMVEILFRSVYYVRVLISP